MEIMKNIKSEVPSVDKVLDIFEFLVDNPSKYTTASLVNKLGIQQTTGYRIINTLIRRSYLVKDAETNYMRLGYKAIRFGNTALTHSYIRRMIHPLLEEITIQTNESTEVAWIENSEIYYLDMTESPQPVRLLRRIGMRILGIRNPVALAILSYLPKEQRRRVISLAVESVKAMRKMGIDVDQQGIVYDKDIDENTLKSVLKTGYVLDYGVQKKDIARIAVPILNNQNIAIGALCTAGPIYRMLPEQQTQIISILRKNIEKITILLGYDTD